MPNVAHAKPSAHTHLLSGFGSAIIMYSWRGQMCNAFTGSMAYPILPSGLLTGGMVNSL